MTAVTQPTLGLTGRARHRGDATSALGQHFCVVGAGAARGDNQTKTNFWILRNSVSHTHTHTHALAVKLAIASARSGTVGIGIFTESSSSSSRTRRRSKRCLSLTLARGHRVSRACDVVSSAKTFHSPRQARLQRVAAGDTSVAMVTTKIL